MIDQWLPGAEPGSVSTLCRLHQSSAFHVVTSHACNVVDPFLLQQVSTRLLYEAVEQGHTFSSRDMLCAQTQYFRESTQEKVHALYQTSAVQRRLAYSLAAFQDGYHLLEMTLRQCEAYVGKINKGPCCTHQNHSGQLICRRNKGSTHAQRKTLAPANKHCWPTTINTEFNDTDTVGVSGFASTAGQPAQGVLEKPLLGFEL